MKRFIKKLEEENQDFLKEFSMFQSGFNTEKDKSFFNNKKGLCFSFGFKSNKEKDFLILVGLECWVSYADEIISLFKTNNISKNTQNRFTQSYEKSERFGERILIQTKNDEKDIKYVVDYVVNVLRVCKTLKLLKV